MIELHNSADMPDLTHVDHLEEPRIKVTILVLDDYLGDVLDGTQPLGFTSDWVKRHDLPSDWSAQRKLLATL